MNKPPIQPAGDRMMASQSATDIFSRSDGFKMIRADTGTITAEVIELHPFGDSTLFSLISVSRSRNKTTIDAEMPISLPCTTPNPIPTFKRRCLPNKEPETLFDRLLSWQRPIKEDALPPPALVQFTHCAARKAAKASTVRGSTMGTHPEGSFRGAGEPDAEHVAAHIS